MHIRIFIYLVFLAVVSMIIGCGQKTTIVLLPDPNGTVGQLTVSTKGGSVEIDRAGEAVVVSSATKAPPLPEPMSNEEIEKRFSTVLSALPAQPEHFLLYFKHDSTELTTESTRLIADILAAAADRRSENIHIIGHSDTLGDSQFNLRLSQKRADLVRELLRNRGVNDYHMSTTSHGEEDPLIKTEDNVPEPRNRRVEVVVR